MTTKKTLSASSAGATKPGHTEKSMHRPRNVKEENIVQNFIIFWLDASLDDSDPDFQTSYASLKKIIYQIEVFTSVDECLLYIHAMKKRKIFLVVSGAIGRTIINEINKISIIQSVWVYCANVEFHSKWAKAVPKIKGVYNHIEPICRQIAIDTKDCEKSNIAIAYNDLDPIFVYSQLLKQAVLDIKDDYQKSLAQFTVYCKSFEDIDDDQLQEFLQNYKKHPAIWWYTRDNFIPTMVNRGLYEMNVNIIEAMAFFIRDLHNNIKQVYLAKHRNDRQAFQLYRGQGLPVEAFKKMKQANGDLMCFQNFLSTSRDRHVSFHFARRAATNSNTVGVLFHMIIHPEVTETSDTPYASVADIGFYDDGEQEILFTTHTIFRILDIKSIGDDETDRLFEVKLTLVGIVDEKFRKLTKSIRHAAEKRIAGWFRFGWILLQLNETEKALFIFRSALANATNDNEEYESAFFLGHVYMKKSDYANAIIYYEKAVNIKRRTAGENDYSLASSYMNIGSAYCNTNNYTKALQYHQKSLELKRRSLPEDHQDLAASYMNIGIVFYRMKNYSKALEYYEQSLQITEKHLGDSNVDVAPFYMNIGSVLHKTGQYDKALFYYLKSLEIREKLLPERHQNIADSHYNIGLLLEDTGKYSESLKHLQLSVEIWQSSPGENESNIADAKKWIRKIKDKYEMK